MMPSFAYARPASLGEALERLAQPGSRALAGGTDLLGCLRDGSLDAETVVSLASLEELRGIEETADGGLSLGALASLSEVAESALVRGKVPGLAEAALSVATPQLRNQGTVGGNLCQRPRCWYFRGGFDCAKKGGDRCYAMDGESRYHAVFAGGPCYAVHPSDLAPMLVALGSSVRLAGPRGARTVPLEELFLLPADDLRRETDLGAGELVARVLVPHPGAGHRSSYRKVRERGAWDFALASVALSVRLAGRRVGAVRVVLGGVAPVPWRARGAEEALAGRVLNDAAIRDAASAAVVGAEPLGQNGYKVPLVRAVVEASLEDLLSARSAA